MNTHPRILFATLVIIALSGCAVFAEEKAKPTDEVVYMDTTMAGQGIVFQCPVAWIFIDTDGDGYPDKFEGLFHAGCMKAIRKQAEEKKNPHKDSIRSF